METEGASKTAAGGLSALKISAIVIAFVVCAGLAIGLGVGLTQSKDSDSKNTDKNLPFIVPPVEAACPPGLKNNAKSLDTSVIKDRFFNPTGGPSNLFDILQNVDNRIQGINDRIQQFPCLGTATPVSFDLNIWPSGTETFFAQCSETFGPGPSFDQFGIVGENFYIYENGGEVMVAAKLHRDPVTGVTDRVDVWYSVGLINLGGSHGVVQIVALPLATPPVFEMSVAGAGLGFCGAQLRADDQTIFAIGSEDTPSCGDIDTTCCSATNVGVASTACNGTTDSGFTLPAFGRRSYSTHAESKYPSTGGNIVLADDGNDQTRFGPSTPVV
eukprot:c21303_g1_i1.p1 GENE.c21303_g1_i1~~c21303_g1_i1.p1  ORF type:complete len:329 (-),score=55.51 c21303_g1_i1:84-1070(-)